MMRKSTVYILLVVWMALTSVVIAEDSNVELSIQEGWSSLFAGSEAVFHAALKSEKNIDGRLTWRLSAGGKTLQRGERAEKITPEKITVVELKLNIPDLKEGVIQQLSLDVSFSHGKDTSADISRKLWVFTENAFYLESEWLKSLDIHLFDPEGKTDERLTEEEIPFTKETNIDSFADLKGLLVIGEKVSFKEYRGLGKAIVKAVESGSSVLCLAPSGGELLLPGMGEESESDVMPAEITIQGNNIIRKLDKRLDSKAWASDGVIASGSIMIVGERGPVTAVFSDESKGWSWLEVKYNSGSGDKKGRLVVASFNIIDKWDASPTPRFLFERMLKRVGGNKKKENEK